MSKKVLLVDDAKTMLQLVGYTLSEAGYEIATAQNAEAALAQLDTGGPFNMVITDLNMPGMNGIEFIRAMKNKPGYRFTPVAVLSTENRMELRKQAEQAGASFWIVKPFAPNELLNLVNKYAK